jgi:hypothetical protein
MSAPAVVRGNQRADDPTSALGDEQAALVVIQ